MGHPYWPLFDLRLRLESPGSTGGELLLRPMTEADQPALADLLPPDVELDPAAPTYALGNPRLQRGVVCHQAYWRGYGAWTPAHWRLSFVVLADGELVGAQELEGTDYVLLRTVDTASFLVPEARGMKIGKAMRAAVLTLAFSGLGAQAAITSAWRDNEASLGVSRSLGYRPNGEHLHARGDATDVMVHLRMTRDDWLAQPRPQVTMSGLEPCLPLFGL
ncbi:MAG TPA: GNAT family protein [Candidatus Limnocylindria bacterium]|nr:GNAT family protein [Candidatus Limnocylindria bacterium]